MLLEPSVVSLCLCVIISGIFLTAMSWAFILHSALPYDYLFGRYGLTGLDASPDNVIELWRRFIGRSLWQDVASFLFIFVIGAIVYTVLQGSNKVVNSALGDWEEVHDADASFRQQIRAQVLHRAGFRLFVLVSWCVYSVACLTLLVPFCVSSARYGIAIITQPTGWLYVLLGCGLLAVALHLHVIFMRLMALRPRLFGDQAILALGRNR
jgi:hypothetical protein